MNKTSCPICNETKNTFVVDQSGFLEIRLCWDCAKKQGMEKYIDLKKTKVCRSCGKRFRNPREWAKSCPICFIKSRPKKLGQRGALNKSQRADFFVTYSKEPTQRRLNQAVMLHG